MLPTALRQWARPLEPALWRLLIPGGLMDGFDLACRAGSKVCFAQRLLDALDILFNIDDCDRKRIPADGAAVTVANHPYRIVEGLILAALMDRIRPDWKLVVNSMLAEVAELRSHLILVSPFDAPDAKAQNLTPMRESLRLLAAGGTLVMFPAGEVAHVNWTEHSITDPPWKATAARLAIRARSPVVPVFFEGANSMPFHVAGVLHPGLRTMGLDSMSIPRFHTRWTLSS